MHASMHDVGMCLSVCVYHYICIYLFYFLSNFLTSFFLEAAINSENSSGIIEASREFNTPKAIRGQSFTMATTDEGCCFQI